MTRVTPVALVLGIAALTAGLYSGGGTAEAGPGCPPPANDSFANSTAIASLPFSDSVCDDNATSEPGEPSCLGPGGTFWYSFTPSISQVITLRASSIYSRMAVYAGSSLGSLSSLEPPICDFGVTAQFVAIEGQTYHIQVGYSDSFQAEAAYPPGLDFSLGIDLDEDSVDDCTTRAGGPYHCTALPNRTFMLKVYLDTLPPGLGLYDGFSATVVYSGLVSEHTADLTPWPDCVGTFGFFENGLDNGACVTAFSAYSDYAGLMATFMYTCTADGTLTLRHGSGFDTFITSNFNIRFEAGIDTLQVSCNGVPPPPVSGAASDVRPRGGSAFEAWWVAAIAGMAFVALGGAAYARRRG